jgi:hypothetical protein
MTKQHIYDYEVVEATSTTVLIHEVNTLIDRGYQPLGGIAVSVYDDDDCCGECFVQAMGKIGEEE